jgi:hypothetical protein
LSPFALAIELYCLKLLSLYSRLYRFHSASRFGRSPHSDLVRKDHHIVCKTEIARHNITMPNDTRASIAMLAHWAKHDQTKVHISLLLGVKKIAL